MIGTETGQPHLRGGLYFEDFVVGSTMAHRLTRTVTQMDNMLYAGIVTFVHRAYKQDGTLVAESSRQAFMKKRGSA